MEENRSMLSHMESEKITLKANQITKVYAHRTVVDSLSIQIKQGEVVGILGPNGAGKTTSFYMMVGLIKPDEGQVFLNEKDISEKPIHKRALDGIAYLPQEACIFRDLSVEDNIFSVLECRSLGKVKKKVLLDKLINDFSLSHIRKSKGSDLSGGERRRVEIARTLALDPKFVLLDEPFAGVDPLAVIEIQKIIENLKSRNIGVLITDHNVRETLGIVDRAYIMSKGKLLLSGQPDEIINNDEAKKYYLGENFKL
jgi:lipopolysaccharide export system ATP-binding protein